MESIIYNDDCIKGLQNIDANFVDACITDPPYNYEFIGHKWDANEIKRRIDRWGPPHLPICRFHPPLFRAVMAASKLSSLRINITGLYPSFLSNSP